MKKMVLDIARQEGNGWEISFRHLQAMVPYFGDTPVAGEVEVEFVKAEPIAGSGSSTVFSHFSVKWATGATGTCYAAANGKADEWLRAKLAE